MAFRPESLRSQASSYEPNTASLLCTIGTSAIDMKLFADDGRADRFTSSDQGAVLNAIDQLIAEADMFTTCVGNWVENTPDLRRKEDQDRLKSAGERVGDLLFPGEAAKRFVGFLEIRKIDLVNVVVVDDRRLTFPWHLVRIPSVDRWLGEVACFRMLRDGNGPLLDTTDDRDEGGVVAGYADDDCLMSGRPSTTTPDATAAELQALRQVASSNVVILDDLPPGKLGASALATMQEWLSKPLHLFHFNSHSSDPGDSEGYTDIGLRIGARASGRHILEGLALTGAVVLDVCLGAHGVKNQWQNCWAGCLQSRGVPAICATTSTVTDAFGTRFSEELYRQLPLHDHRLFKAFRVAQAALLGEVGHPMPLYYTFEGSARFEVGRY